MISRLYCYFSLLQILATVFLVALMQNAHRVIRHDACARLVSKVTRSTDVSTWTSARIILAVMERIVSTRREITCASVPKAWSVILTVLAVREFRPAKASVPRTTTVKIIWHASKEAALILATIYRAVQTRIASPINMQRGADAWLVSRRARTTNVSHVSINFWIKLHDLTKKICLVF